MTGEQQFFYDNAGWSYMPSKETPKQGRYNSARRYAKAERLARIAGIVFNWRYDPDGCVGCDCGECECSTGEPHDTLQCTATLPDGTIGASLGGICRPDKDYRRVIEAELAIECM